ncbi:MAG: hypothetical protein U9R74_09570, partial [Pseudomonadota bacterium]|nr:hypothetical protein [Pseudomonadota bacterium]
MDHVLPIDARSLRHTRVTLTWLALIFFCAASLAQDRARYYSFDDRLTDYEGGHPDWFKVSFFDLN